jgi:hypothetical protein
MAESSLSRFKLSNVDIVKDGDKDPRLPAGRCPAF